MAEFQEVMKQLNRLCGAHENCDEDNCPMEAMGCCGNIAAHCSEPLQAKRIEKTVMQWAAEHSEPVYPTWEEWLISMGLIEYKASLENVWHGDCNVTNGVIKALNARAGNPIPADIAQKLGLEPKEE